MLFQGRLVDALRQGVVVEARQGPIVVSQDGGVEFQRPGVIVKWPVALKRHILWLFLLDELTRLDGSQKHGLPENSDVCPAVEWPWVVWSPDLWPTVECQFLRHQLNIHELYDNLLYGHQLYDLLLYVDRQYF